MWPSSTAWTPNAAISCNKGSLIFGFPVAIPWLSISTTYLYPESLGISNIRWQDCILKDVETKRPTKVSEESNSKLIGIRFWCNAASKINRSNFTERLISFFHSWLFNKEIVTKIHWMMWPQVPAVYWTKMNKAWINQPYQATKFMTCFEDKMPPPRSRVLTGIGYRTYHHRSISLKILMAMSRMRVSYRKSRQQLYSTITNNKSIFEKQGLALNHLMVLGKQFNGTNSWRGYFPAL